MANTAAGALGMAATRQSDTRWVALPLIILLGIQVGLTIWLSPRGFDFTDEAFYLLSYMHWREFSALATFFGAYFALPFAWLGQDVAAMRVFGMSALLLSGGFFAWRAMTFDRDREVGAPSVLPFVIGGMVGSLFYYSYVTTLRTPSYNLLVLVCMLGATGLLLTIVEGRCSRHQARAAALGYGLLLGTCLLGKATSGVATLVCHAVFYAVFSKQARTFELAGYALIGLLLNFAVLHAVHPDWWRVLHQGVLMATNLDGRYTSLSIPVLWEASIRGAQRILLPLLLVALLFAGVVRRWGRSNRHVLSALIVAMVTGIMWTILVQGYGKSWWVLLLFGTGAFWLAGRLCSARALPARAALPTLGLTILLFALPIAFSVGTNGSLPAHTQMAAVFGVVALMLPLRRLWSLGLIHRGALVLTLTALCLPTLVLQLRSLDNTAFTYRLRTGLLDQVEPVRLGPGGASLLLDRQTAGGIELLGKTMRKAGYVTGSPVLDVTGDGPGLVYVVGGTPVGVAWLIGGYSGSEKVAAQVFASVPAATLREAWIISAQTNPRAIRGWIPSLRSQLGEGSHVMVAKVPYLAQYRWDGLPPVPDELSIWRPASAAGGNALPVRP